MVGTREPGCLGPTVYRKKLTTEADNNIDATLNNYTTDTVNADLTPESALREIDVISQSKDELAELLPCSCEESDEFPCWFCVLAGLLLEL